MEALSANENLTAQFAIDAEEDLEQLGAPGADEAIEPDDFSRADFQ